jgi:hypothetical protein
MDRWSALAMLESGDNDNATGPWGEISRFQIRPQLWPGGDPRDSQIALAVAQNIMRARLDAFEASHKRPPTDFEFYVLWNAPSEVNYPSRIVADRARRFANLVQRNDNPVPAINPSVKVTAKL